MWRPYDDASPFNMPVAGDVQVNPRSSAIVSRVLQWGKPANMVVGTADTQDDFAHPVYFAQADDPVVTLRVTETSWGSNSLNGMRIQVPAQARPAGGSDGHMTIVEPDGWEYDLWQAQLPANGKLSFSWGGRLRADGSGIGAPATAAGFGSLAGSIRVQELEAGRIDHALFIVLPCVTQQTSFGYGVQAHAAGDLGASFVYPASKGATGCGTGQSDADLPPTGARFQLSMTSAQIGALNVPAWRKTILHALATYGGYVGDTGGSAFGIQYESGSTYTSFGKEDPWNAFGRSVGAPRWNGHYVLNIADGVDWARYLRVVAPPSRTAG